MCLAKAFINKWNDKPVLQDIAHMRLNGGQVQMETLFGEEKVISGRVVEVDFTNSRIFLEEYREPDRLS